MWFPPHIPENTEDRDWYERNRCTRKDIDMTETEMLTELVEQVDAHFEASGETMEPPLQIIMDRVKEELGL